MKLFEYILDIVVPKSGPARSIHHYITPIDIRCSLSRRTTNIQNTCFDELFYLYKYSIDDVSSLIQRAKVGGEIAICKDLAQIFSEQYTAHNPCKKADIVTYIPADPKRKRKRGYHTPEIFAKYISRELNVPYQAILQKSHSTTSQTDLDLEARKNNLKHVFSINPAYQALPNISTIWLIDDVITTGTTMNESARALRKIYPKSWIIGIGIAG